MREDNKCLECGGALGPDAAAGRCSKCLGRRGPETQTAAGKGSPGSRFVPPDPAELAKHFPQLEILEVLGQGGMGVVYKARQVKLDRLVALKILPPEMGTGPNFAERFAREARTLAKLSHPNIVGIHDFGEADGLFYFVMEYVDGLSLRQLLKARQLSPQEALRIVPQICDALETAHENGVVHRDIKPENVLLDKKGHVKIADFGLAKLLEHTPADLTLTATQQVVGTHHYMAPEQLFNPQEVDHRADIFSLGVVFYEMLTGELPVGHFAPPSERVEIDVRLDQVVLRALEREPDRRYQHATEVKTDVEAIATPTADAGQPGAAAGFRRRSRFTTPLLVLLSVAVVALVLRDLMPRPAPTKPPEPPFEIEFTTDVVDPAETARRVYVRQNHAIFIDTSIPLTRVEAVGADVVRLESISERRLQIIGQLPGTAQVFVWAETNEYEVFEIIVVPAGLSPGETQRQTPTQLPPVGEFSAEVVDLKGKAKRVRVAVDQSLIIETSIPVKRVEVAGELLRLDLVEDRRIVVNGVEAGITHLIVWSPTGEYEVFEIHVAQPWETQPAGQLLANPGFEDGQSTPAAWSTGDAVEGMRYVWGKDVAYQGHASVGIKNTLNTYAEVQAEWTQRITHNTFPARLRVSAHVKAAQVGQAVIAVRCAEFLRHKYEEERVTLIGTLNRDDPPLDHDWLEYSGVVDIPADTAEIIIALQMFGPGTVWFDDVNVEYVDDFANTESSPGTLQDER